VTYEDLRLERRDGAVLLVTLHRPDALNAIGARMRAELARLWADLARDAETRAVVVTGAGRAFCAGGDLKELDAADPEAIARDTWRMVSGILELDRPVVAAVNGAAVGGGLALALACDVAVAAEDAQLVDGHVSVGLVPGDHAILTWPLLTSMAKAKYHLLTGEPLTGAEAERIGLVAAAVPRDDVLPAALDLAARLARGSGPAIRGTKRALATHVLRARPQHELAAALELLVLDGPDAAEARGAFREKRRPDFVRDTSPRG
jgi:enoyl-CoA hydratase